MPRAGLVALSVAAFVVGASVAGAGVWLLTKHSTTDAVAQAASAGLGNKLRVLDALRKGDTNAAIAALEIQLDSDLVVLGLVPESALGPATKRAIGRAATYRIRYPHSSGDATIDSAVKDAMSKRSATGSEAK